MTIIFGSAAKAPQRCWISPRRNIAGAPATAHRTEVSAHDCTERAENHSARHRTGSLEDQAARAHDPQETRLGACLDRHGAAGRGHRAARNVFFQQLVPVAAGNQTWLRFGAAFAPPRLTRALRAAYGRLVRPEAA